jgi:hypothetical protein
VFSLTAPAEDEVRRFISKQKDSSFSYPDVGASAAAVPAGYNVDRNRSIATTFLGVIRQISTPQFRTPLSSRRIPLRNASRSCETK